ncbi:MAG: multidrug effflux MFS transporter [Pseudomonadota bacterium]
MAQNPGVRFLDRTTPPHIVTLVLISGAAAMAMNMFLPSLPSMAEHFGVEYSVMQLSVALFLAGNAVLQLIIGPLSDRFGRRRLLLGGFTIFVITSLACIFAPTIEAFLIFRVIQATSVVGIALGRAVIRDMYNQEQSAAMIGYVTMGMAVVPMLAPMLGGVLDSTFGWQSVFVAYILLGLATIWLISADLGETHSSQGRRFRDQAREYPELLMSPRFWGYALSAAFSSGAFFSYLGGAPFIGGEVFGLEPQLLGVALGIPALGYIAGNYVTARYTARVGLNRMVLMGGAICVFGMAASLGLFFVGLGNVYTFFGLMVFIGLGNGLVMPNAIAGSLSVRPSLAGTASGLGGALMIGGGAALSALAGSWVGPGTGAEPLLYIQLTVSVLSVVAILFVIRRERRLGIPAAAE